MGGVDKASPTLYNVYTYYYERTVMPTDTKQKNKERIALIEREFGSLKGKTIALVRPLMEAECEQFAWEYDYEDYAMAIFFTDGTVLVPSQDPEGNGAGFLFLIESEGAK